MPSSPLLGHQAVPLVLLRLDRVDTERLERFVTDAWRMRAPQELVGDFEVTESG